MLRKIRPLDNKKRNVQNGRAGISLSKGGGSSRLKQPLENTRKRVFEGISPRAGWAGINSIYSAAASCSVLPSALDAHVNRLVLASFLHFVMGNSAPLPHREFGGLLNKYLKIEDLSNLFKS